VTLRQKYLRILSSILPAGALGASLLLGSAATAAAKDDPAASQPRASDAVRVSERLAAIRQAVSDVADNSRGEAKDGRQVAWWGNWRNGGGGWGAWRNGGGGWGGWRNGGWRNGGWRNGGWHNGWPNYWRNW
jgi:rSAM-associated Gly-rich repeat protein